MWINNPTEKQQDYALIDAFMSSHPTIKVNMVEKSATGYNTAITAALAANAAPDIVGVTPGQQYVAVAKAGRLLDVTKRVNVSALNDAARQVIYVGNKVYGIPFIGEYTTGIFYWKAEFHKYKITPPNTWSEMVNICKKLLNNGLTPIQQPSQDGEIPTFFWTGAMTTVRGPGGVTAVAEGKAKVTDADFMSATQFLKDLVPYYAKGYVSTSYDAGQAVFAEGGAVMLEAGSADYTAFVNENPKAKGGLGFFAFPHPDTTGFSSVNSGVDLLFGINANIKDSAKISAGVTLMQWFMTAKASNQVARTLDQPETKTARVTDPFFREILAQSKYNAPEWYELPQLSALWDYSLEHIGAMMSGAMTVEAFSRGAQAKVSL
jgi:raffinose/stachyose/melibiose transport system substrate-binding protein